MPSSSWTVAIVAVMNAVIGLLSSSLRSSANFWFLLLTFYPPEIRAIRGGICRADAY